MTSELRFSPLYEGGQQWRGQQSIKNLQVTNGTFTVFGRGGSLSAFQHSRSKMIHFTRYKEEIIFCIFSSFTIVSNLGMRLDWSFFAMGMGKGKCLTLLGCQHLTDEKESSPTKWDFCSRSKPSSDFRPSRSDPWVHPHPRYPRHMRKWSSRVPLFLFKLNMSLEKIHSLKLTVRTWQ